MRKSVILLLAAFATSVTTKAQTEQFRIAAYNDQTITIGKKGVSVGAIISLDDTIQWPSDDAALKLYGTTHKKLYLVAAEMKRHKAYTLAQYLARSTGNVSTEVVQQRHTTTRDFGADEVSDTLYLFDSLTYRLPEDLTDDGLLELHIINGKNKYVVNTGQQVTLGEIVIDRKSIQCAAGQYKASVWIKNEIKDWNYPIVDGLRLIILPSPQK